MLSTLTRYFQYLSLRCAIANVRKKSFDQLETVVRRLQEFVTTPDRWSLNVIQSARHCGLANVSYPANNLFFTLPGKVFTDAICHELLKADTNYLRAEGRRIRQRCDPTITELLEQLYAGQTGQSLCMQLATANRRAAAEALTALDWLPDNPTLRARVWIAFDQFDKAVVEGEAAVEPLVEAVAWKSIKAAKAIIELSLSDQCDLSVLRLLQEVRDDVTTVGWMEENRCGSQMWSESFSETRVTTDFAPIRILASIEQWRRCSLLAEKDQQSQVTSVISADDERSRHVRWPTKEAYELDLIPGSVGVRGTLPSLIYAFGYADNNVHSMAKQALESVFPHWRRSCDLIDRLVVELQIVRNPTSGVRVYDALFAAKCLHCVSDEYAAATLCETKYPYQELQEKARLTPVWSGRPIREALCLLEMEFGEEIGTYPSYQMKSTWMDDWYLKQHYKNWEGPFTINCVREVCRLSKRPSVEVAAAIERHVNCLEKEKAHLEKVRRDYSHINAKRRGTG